MHSKFALIENTVNFINDCLNDKRMNRGMGDEILLRMVEHMNDLMKGDKTTKITMLKDGIVLERYVNRFADGVLFYHTGCADPRNDGHFVDQESIDFLKNMMGVK